MLLTSEETVMYTTDARTTVIATINTTAMTGDTPLEFTDSSSLESFEKKKKERGASTSTEW